MGGWLRRATEPRRWWLRPMGVRTLVVASMLLVLTGCSAHSPGVLPADPPVTQALRSQSSQEPLLVPTPKAVLGRWRLISVHGMRPPQGALRGLRLTRRDHRLWANWSDGVNEHGLRWHLTRTGGFRRSDIYETLVGCIGPCTHPSGFGVATADGLRLTATGQLVFLAGSGAEIARYRRVTEGPLGHAERSARRAHGSG
jgi:hypothetical protein